MKAPISLSLLFCAVSSVAAQSSGEVPVNPKLAFTPGVSYNDDCRKTPSGDLCPPFLPSGNLVVTGLNLVLDEGKPDQVPSQSFNIFRVGFNLPNLTQEVTLTAFDFPSGFEDKNCTFHIITNDGDNIAPEVVYSVWSLKDKGKDVSLNTTWKTKPPRDEVVGVAISDLTPIGFAKDSFKFLYGSGFGNEKRPQSALGNINSFKCPPGGKIVFETAQTAKIPTDGNVLNAGGNGGLCIEIADTKVFLVRPI
ncbi:hypothetical protein HOY82DRAFT_560974 [Tuber indicum]|nr:hypothetical protein HOY82DRAFT_560974 [Tuber indicum]